MCRGACLRAEDDCRAYFFDKETSVCEFGSFVEDTIRSSAKYGKKVHVEEGRFGQNLLEPEETALRVVLGTFLILFVFRGLVTGDGQ